MVQLICTIQIPSGGQRILLKRPHSLCRIFFSIKTLADPAAWRRSLISFDDPTFASRYVFDGPMQQLEAKGEGIFQGTIWAYNVSPVDIIFTVSEILI